MATVQKPSLPSIKEMFPEYLMQVPPHMRAPPPMISSELQQQFSRLPGPNHPRSQPLPMNPTGRPRTSNRRYSMTHNLRGPHALQGQSTSSVASSPSPRSPRARSDSLRAQSERTHSNQPEHSFDILRSVPSSSSLQHINSSHTYSSRHGSLHSPYTQAGVSNGSAPVFQVNVLPSNPHPRAPIGDSQHPRSPEQRLQRVELTSAPTTPGSSNYSSIISFPINGSGSGSVLHREASSDDTSNASDDGDLSASNSGKKHICSTCFKRFNRPSSLRIHVNTHTGATPFRCPWPDCGREFNVNSNMRRHFRNHNTPGSSRSQSNDNRRRRRRGPPQGLSHGGGDSTSSRIHITGEGRYITSPPISSLSMSEESDDDMSDTMDGIYAQDEEDELESPHEAFPPDSRRPLGYPPGPRGLPGHPEHMPQQQFAQTRLRPFHHSPANPPISPSPSPPPPEPVYSPSAPYVRSLADSRVSTALRPAFHPQPPLRKQTVKQEPTSDVW